MRKNMYTEIVDSIRLSDRAVEKALKAVRTTEKGDMIMVKRNKLKYTGMIAASLAVVIAGGTAAGQLLQCNQTQKMDSTAASQADSHNSFVLMVNAAELTDEPMVVNCAEETTADNRAAFGMNEVRGISLSEGDENNGYTVGYNSSMPITCKGEHIRYVTYSVDVGAISVSYYKGENPLIDGTETNRCDSTPESGVPLKPAYQKLEKELVQKIPKDAEGEVSWSQEDQKKLEQLDKVFENTENKHYASITIDCSDPRLAYTSISLVGSSVELNAEDRNYLGTHRDDLFGFKGEAGMTEEKACLDKLINGQIVHCTVTFDDGTKQTQDIKVGTAIATYAEALRNINMMTDEKIAAYENNKDVFMTFSLA